VYILGVWWEDLIGADGGRTGKMVISERGREALHKFINFWL
jgi:hypothetical protein